ncbi:MAG: topoisomerase DNA-binding C4 zinc finger domain-containing protein [Acidobacteria bacterium]|nr:topoisomerase DNA-binding C4 zinc finger domain-containing protein [Acidobacteriota bacterium]
MIRWRKGRQQQLACYISEIRSAGYFRRISPSQFESLLLNAFKARQFTVFDDPYLGRSRKQGYAWKEGKKVVVVYHREDSLTTEILEKISKHAALMRAEKALVFHPFPEAAAATPLNTEVLAGDKLLAWFSVLENVVPPIANRALRETCECGSPLRERVNRRGEFLWVCSRFPDCRFMREAAPVTSTRESFVS